jgi:hypothetical protein
VVQDEFDPISAEVASASETRDSTTTHHNAQTSLSEEESHGSQSVVKNFTEHGNVELVVPAAADDQAVHVVVDEEVICAASPVWKAMVTEHMKEVTTLREPRSIEVPLRVDYLPALEVIFSVLHHQTPTCPSPPSLDLIVRVVNACNQYKLWDSLMPWIRDSLGYHSIPELDDVEIGLYMLAAGGCCNDLSQAIRHHALATLTLDSRGQWQTHELLRDSEAKAMTSKYTVSYVDAST